MAETIAWPEHQEMSVFLVSLDIAGFSRALHQPSQLLEHRETFLRAIERTTLFKTAQGAGQVAAHFLGDELRLAFLDTVGARAVHSFVEDVRAALAQANDSVPPERQTRVKGTVFVGVVSRQTWHGCTFLDGELPFQAQRWMSTLEAGEIAIDAECKEALDVAAVFTGPLEERNFDDDLGYILPKRMA